MHWLWMHQYQSCQTEYLDQSISKSLRESSKARENIHSRSETKHEWITSFLSCENLKQQDHLLEFFKLPRIIKAMIRARICCILCLTKHWIH